MVAPKPSWESNLFIYIAEHGELVLMLMELLSLDADGGGQRVRVG